MGNLDGNHHHRHRRENKMNHRVDQNEVVVDPDHPWKKINDFIIKGKKQVSTNHDEHVYFVVDSYHIDQDFDCIVVESHVLAVVLHYLDIAVEIDLVDL
jgi:hypothetical protein